MAMKQRVGSIAYVLESTSDNLPRSDQYVIQCVMTAFPNLRNANLAVAFFNEQGQLVRTVTFGDPSADMKQVMEREFGSDDNQAVTA
jgi:hypothetical protein